MILRRLTSGGVMGLLCLLCACSAPEMMNLDSPGVLSNSELPHVAEYINGSFVPNWSQEQIAYSFSFSTSELMLGSEWLYKDETFLLVGVFDGFAMYRHLKFDPASARLYLDTSMVTCTDVTCIGCVYYPFDNDCYCGGETDGCSMTVSESMY